MMSRTVVLIGPLRGPNFVDFILLKRRICLYSRRAHKISNFICSSATVRSLGSHNKERTHDDGVWEQDAEGDDWGQKMEVKGAGRNLQNEEFHDLHCSPNIIRVTKSRSMKWVGHVARTGRRAMHTGFRWGNRKEKDHMEDLSADGRIMKLIWRKQDGMTCGGLIWPRRGTR